MMEPIQSSRFLQKLYLSLHHRKFNKRLQNQVRFTDKRIVSLGNLSAGGTGKTPLGALLLEMALERGFRPAVVLRGYGGKRSASGGLVFDGQRSLMDPADSGDEAQLYHVKGSRVIVGQNRARAIEQFAEACDFIVLDDAFQNPSVYRDVDLVLLDATVAPDEGGLIPWGRFREPLGALERAHAVILSRADLARGNANLWHEAIRSRFPELPVLYASHVPGRVKPELPAGARILAVSGIGNPAGFEETLHRAGFQIEGHRKYSDHHPYRLQDLRSWQKGWPVITTEKDLVRIRNIVRIPGEESRESAVEGPKDQIGPRTGSTYQGSKPCIRGIHYLPIRMHLDERELAALVFP
ncbi:MAG: tetraacyldisaccharide 4'-kinase [Leptospiraceae bacterium]|nr:tetraacyldisaccharide 4'-kinase [Leptospiraceae bacterium]